MISWTGLSDVYVSNTQSTWHDDIYMLDLIQHHYGTQRHFLKNVPKVVTFFLSTAYTIRFCEQRRVTFVSNGGKKIKKICISTWKFRCT